MNENAALRKKNTGRSILWLLIALLFVFELCSVSVLCSRLTIFSGENRRTVIDLTEGGSQSTVKILPRDESVLPVTNAAQNEQVSLAAGLPVQAAHLPASFRSGENPLPNSDKTGFGVHDKDQIWTTHTDVEIFHLSYDNEKGETTVQTAKGDKVFAPGTESDYGFTITSSKYALTYYLTVEAYYEGTTIDGEEKYIPIDAKMYDYKGEYLVGSAEEWPDVLELNSVSLKRVIAKGGAHDYTIQWRWPFERGEKIGGTGLYRDDYTEDFYDTDLGNLAVDHDMILHIIIRTWAEIDEQTTPPDTGDNVNTVLWAVLAAVALAAIVVLLILLKREKKKEENEAVG